MGQLASVSARELGRAFLALLLVAIIALGVNPFHGDITGPFDLLVSQPGWGDVMSFDHVRHAERSDVLDFYLPRWIEARKQLRGGHLPLWNPLPVGGEPGLLNLAAGELTPAFILFAALPVAAWGLLAAMLFNLTMGGLGVFVFVRRHASVFPALFAAVTVMLCGFNAAWLYWPHVSTAMWIGWLLWGIDRAMSRDARYIVAAVSVPLAGLLLGGFPFVSVLGIGAALLYLACVLLMDPGRRDRSYASRLILGLVLALGLAMPGLLGMKEWLQDFDLSGRFTGSVFSYRDIGLLFPAGARQHAVVESSMYAGGLALGLTLVAIITVGASYFVRRRRPTLLLFFSLALLACAATLVFELIPHGLIAWMPGLANNQWSRAICLLDIAIALGAASSIQYLDDKLRRGLFIPLAVCLLSAQFADLTSYFRLFNGSVPARYYYPSLVLADRMAADASPFQSAVADDSFLVSGTLGAYGVAEWFGHGFRTEALKKVLAMAATDPLTTPTASRLDATAFHLDSPVLSALGVRYAIGGEGMTSFLVGPPAVARKADRVALPAMPAATLTQRIVLSGPRVIEGVSFSLASYGRQFQHGTLHVELFRRDVPAVLARWSVPAAEILDNRLRTFELPSPLALDAAEYVLKLAYTDPAPGDALTVWSFPGHWAGCSVEVNEQPASGCMDFGLRIRRADLGNFVETDSAHGMHLLENRDVPAGAYFMATLADHVGASASESVTFAKDRISGFTLRYSGRSPGFVVVPMSWRSGWHVTVDGASLSPHKFLGVLPAFPVKGPAELGFVYRPISAILGLPIALVAFIVLLAVSSRERRSRLANPSRSSRRA